MSGCDSQNAETSKDSMSNHSVDEGLPREMSQLSLSSTASQDETFRHKGHAHLAFKSIFEYYLSSNMCDVVLIAGTRRISAHRIVLASCSDYFAAMFTVFKEAHQAEVPLERVDPQALASLVKYCYTGTVELREETVETLMSTASLLQLHTVIGACCSYLKKQLDPCNCLGIALFAEQHSCKELHQQALEYTYQNFMQVVKNQEFLSLSVEHLADILKSEYLNVSSEEDVFESMMAWVQHDGGARQRHLPALLEHIKLPLIAPEYLLDNVEVSCLGVAGCQPLVMEAVKWHLLPARRAALQSRRTRPRASTVGRLIAVGGSDRSKDAYLMEVYEPRADVWRPFARLGARRLQFGAAMLQQKLIVVGGRDGLKTLNTVECLDLTTQKWSTLAPMNTHRHGLGVAVLGEGPGAPVYAVGGHDGWIYLNSVERWDACSRSWTLVAPMASARSTCGVATLGGRLYAAGGRDGGSCLRSVECYDPATNLWSACAPMTRRRGGVSMCSAGGYLYALGGHEAPANSVGGRLACVERYDPAADAWLQVARLSCARDAVGACLLGGRIVAVGGFDGMSYINTVEMYDPEEDCWRMLAPMTVGRAGAAVVAVPPASNTPTTPTTSTIPTTSIIPATSVKPTTPVTTPRPYM